LIDSLFKDAFLTVDVTDVK